MKSKIHLIKINSRDNQTIGMSENIRHLRFIVDDKIFIITPDFDGFRINKVCNDGSSSNIMVEPSSNNEITIH